MTDTNKSAQRFVQITKALECPRTVKELSEIVGARDVVMRRWVQALIRAGAVKHAGTHASGERGIQAMRYQWIKP